MYIHSRKGIRYHSYNFSLIFYLIIQAVSHFLWTNRIFYRFETSNNRANDQLVKIYLGLGLFALFLIIDINLNVFQINTLENFKGIILELACIIAPFIFIQSVLNITSQRNACTHYMMENGTFFVNFFVILFWIISLKV